MPIDYTPTPRAFDPTAPLAVDLTDLDAEAIGRLGTSLGVEYALGESADDYRARVGVAFNSDDTIDAAIPTPQPAPRPFVLGGMKLGD